MTHHNNLDSGHCRSHQDSNWWDRRIGESYRSAAGVRVGSDKTFWVGSSQGHSSSIWSVLHAIAQFCWHARHDLLACCIGAELRAAVDAKASAAITSEPASNSKTAGHKIPADDKPEESLLQCWLDCRENDTATSKLDLEVAELIEELQPNYPEFTWRDHLCSWLLEKIGYDTDSRDSSVLWNRLPYSQLICLHYR